MGAYTPIIDQEAECIAYDIAELFIRTYGNAKVMAKDSICEE